MLRVLSDIHGDGPHHINVCRAVNHSTIQIGDLGFSYNYLHHLDPAKDRFFGGNHDNYDTINQYPHNLGDYGVIEAIDDANKEPLKLFFVRGAFSIDRAYRVEGRDWWANEQLSYAELLSAYDLYCETKPDIVLSHDGPQYVSDKLHGTGSINTVTGQALNNMLFEHPPKAWYYGHHHVNRVDMVFGCELRCLLHMTYIDIPVTITNW